MERRTFLKASLAGPAAGMLGTVAAATADEDELAAEITAVLRKTEEGWASQDTKRLLELWDPDDADPIYLAAEQPDWFRGWEDINNYLDPPAGTPQVTQAIRVGFHDITVKRLSDDLAFVACRMRTEMKLVFNPKPFASDNRVSAVFRRKPEGWRYVCYTEAFPTPMVAVQEMMEQAVSPDYQEFFDAVTGKSD